MATNAIQDTGSTTGTQTGTAQQKRNTGEMGRDEFLKLLVTQLKYQDPLQPTDDKEFIAQMAQFSSLEQMQNLNSSFSSMKAFSLMGKDIAAAYKDEETGEETMVSGVVEKVKMSSGKVYVQVGDHDVPVDGIGEITQTNVTKVTDLMPLIGRKIQGKLLDESGGLIDVTGAVSSIKKVGSLDVAVLDDIELKDADVVLPEGLVEYKDSYLDRNIGKEVTVKVKDKNGRDVTITGILQESAKNDSGLFDVKLNQIDVPVDNIIGIAQEGQTE